jgi:hypothetical protein
MRVVLWLAVILGQFAWLRSRSLDWDARRVQMYQQRDVTRALMAEWKSDPRFADASGPTQDDPRSTPTSEWAENLTISTPGGPDPGARGVRASGFLSRLSLFSGAGPGPITVEVFDPRFLDGPWLARLFREYEERGWRYTLVSPSAADSPRGANAARPGDVSGGRPQDGGASPAGSASTRSRPRDLAR